ncbi:MAG: alpha-glucan family phosphorylase [Parachlamydia sp.]|nr:alpha-glucan family phosphorylase [Parachlamydia sp.]
MTQQINSYHRSDIKGFDSLLELALDLRWSWKHRTDKVWEQLEPALWERTHNPWIVLQTVSRETLEKALADPSFRKIVDDLLVSNRQESEAPLWFQQNCPNAPLTHVAYFSMEFMLSEALPIYSGGLGNVAGDQLKAASDLGVPVAAVGLLYQQGYFRQMIDKEGNQQELYPYNDPGQLPLTPLRKPDGEWLRLEIKLPGQSVWLRTWKVKVGRVTLYLLDSNDPANLPIHRGITSELYGGGPELRLKQELILGIGGWRLLEAIGINPEVCHLNEGHAAFAILERAKSYMRAQNVSFEVALTATRAGNLFTTHTAVPAGFDRFSPALIEQYLTRYAKDLGLPLHDFMALGRAHPEDSAEPFNMAYLAIRGSGAVNGVSRLHGKVSRHIFMDLFPRWTESEIPVGHVTNGVHAPSWDSQFADDLWTEACGKNRWLWTTENIEKNIRAIPDEKLWKMRSESRNALVEFARKRLSLQLSGLSASSESIESALHLFDPNTLTLGFARRFATYKRPNMLLHNPERLFRILSNAQRPVQLIIAGKAHPADKPGKELIRRWMQFITRPECRPHIIFLSDYDMGLTEKLVQGVDVWINTPRRPWEACGTSGMKVLVNGGLNLSELDGWWAEAYSPELGWAIGDGQEHGDDPTWDAVEANALYDLLEQKIIPEFYSRDEEGRPRAWISRIRESMAGLTAQFSANRCVREYTEKYYLPAAAAFKARTGSLSTQIVDWRHALSQKWSALRFSSLKTETKGNRHAFELQLYLNGLDPSMVQVEIYAEGNPPLSQPMKLVRSLSGDPSTFVYTASVPSSHSVTDYTARVVPFHGSACVPLENSLILWQH